MICTKNIHVRCKPLPCVLDACIQLLKSLIGLALLEADLTIVQVSTRVVENLVSFALLRSNGFLDATAPLTHTAVKNVCAWVKKRLRAFSRTTSVAPCFKIVWLIWPVSNW